MPWKHSKCKYAHEYWILVYVRLLQVHKSFLDQKDWFLELASESEYLHWNLKIVLFCPKTPKIFEKMKEKSVTLRCMPAEKGMWWICCFGILKRACRIKNHRKTKTQYIKPRTIIAWQFIFLLRSMFAHYWSGAFFLFCHWQRRNTFFKNRITYSDLAHQNPLESIYSIVVSYKNKLRFPNDLRGSIFLTLLVGWFSAHIVIYHYSLFSICRIPFGQKSVVLRVSQEYS